MIDQLRILEHTGMCRALSFLLDHPEGILRIAYRHPPLNLSPRTAKAVHDALFNAGLIENLRHKDQFMFALTEKGRVLAQKIKDAELFLDTF
jgi:predicted transcriptional regulator